MASVFFSYSHKDEAFRDQLESHLALLKHQGLIDAWHDRRITAGDQIDDAIFSKLETADIILLLVSSDFISSSYCYSREMARAMERHDAGQARVIPVILRHCMWHDAPFGKLMAVPLDGKPIASLPDRDEAIAQVAAEVAKAVKAVGGSAAPAPAISRLRAAATAESSADMANPRSSNLRLKKEFSEKDRDEFMRSTFDFICRYFEGSVDAISARNTDVTGTFERIDSRRMATVLYRGGKKIAQCSIRQEGLSRDNGIAFSHDASANHGSFNELLSVGTDDQSLFMTALGMGWSGSKRDQHLSQEGAAEFYWDMFIRSAQ